ncbi:hypothetical protein Leryth_012260 [Lithospermum erythrorhizon]|uniref:HNH nuclease domain-containing protein n=1 Tax=Lithospermum erythrorhizon TaxID=34254 RepID=A0AAV3P3N0_LITER|nr:hypothetical protein Leryth_012260 [Lithospermum erythrorhizon]
MAKLKPLINGNGLYEINCKDHGNYKFFSGVWRCCGSPSVNQKLQQWKIRCSNSSPSSSSSQKSKKKEMGNPNEDDILDEIVADMKDEFEVDELAPFRGLVLDISYRPVNVVCWKRAICLEFMEKADVLEYYDQTVRSSNGSFYIPAVLRVPHLLQVIKRRRRSNTLCRKNVLLRDDFTCQYCSSGDKLTIDHVIPIARGGEWTWENLVTACASCNSKKGHKTLAETNMKLMKEPKAPKDYDILAIPLTATTLRMMRMRNGTPEEWHQYLPKQGP